MYLLLLAIIYLAFISLGLPDSLLGSAWPMIRVDFGVPISYMGIVSMVISGGTIITSLFSERLIKRFTAKYVTIVSVFLTAIALLGFSYSTNFIQLCLWGIPYGIGAGCIDAALNNYVALHYSSKHMSWLHCFWGVGTIISPYIMSYALVHSVWADGYRMVSYMQMTIAFVILLALPLWKVNQEADEEQQNTKALGVRGSLRVKGVPYLLVGFFAYCAAECTAMLWTSSYLEVTRGLTKDEAAAYGALFFIGITAGRFLAGFVTDKVGDMKMIYIGSAIGFLGLVCVAIPYGSFAIAGFVLFGFGCAPIYPCVIHSTPSNFGAENSQGIIGVQMASAYVGSTFMPPVFGLIANHIDMRWLPVYMGLLFVLMVAMFAKTQRVCRG